MNKEIEVNSENEFVGEVCKYIEECANENIEKYGSFTFVLSGGRTPKKIFQELAKNYENSIDWTKVHFFWLDERCVSPDHKDSNYKLAYDHLISKLCKVGSIHRIKGELEPSEAARDYKKDILSFFDNRKIIFDFILLGMGEDGHVASIFPNSEELEHKEQLVMATKNKYTGYYRVTLGLDVIKSAKFKLLMARGEKKKAIVKLRKSSYPVNLIESDIVIFDETLKDK